MDGRIVVRKRGPDWNWIKQDGRSITRCFMRACIYAFNCIQHVHRCIVRAYGSPIDGEIGGVTHADN